MKKKHAILAMSIGALCIGMIMYLYSDPAHFEKKTQFDGSVVCVAHDRAHNLVFLGVQTFLNTGYSEYQVVRQNTATYETKVMFRAEGLIKGLHYLSSRRELLILLEMTPILDCNIIYFDLVNNAISNSFSIEYGNIFSSALSPDEKRIAVNQSNRIQVADVNGGKVDFSLPLSSAADAIDFFGNDRLVISSNAVCIYSITDKITLQTQIPIADNVLAFCCDTVFITMLTSNGSVYEYNVKTNTIRNICNMNVRLDAPLLRLNADYIVVTNCNILHVFNRKDLSIRRIKNHSNFINCLLFLDVNRFLSGSKDRSACYSKL